MKGIDQNKQEKKIQQHFRQGKVKLKEKKPIDTFT